MASPDITVKAGDTRDWTFTLSDADADALDLTSARVWFKLRRHEWATSDLFYRDTAGTGSDNIAIADTATTGVVTITPIAADWSDLSDSSGVFVGEFKVSDQNQDLMFTKDIRVRIDETVF